MDSTNGSTNGKRGNGPVVIARPAVSPEALATETLAVWETIPAGKHRGRNAKAHAKKSKLRRLPFAASNLSSSAASSKRNGVLPTASA